MDGLAFKRNFSSLSLLVIFITCPLLVIIEIINRAIKGDHLSQLLLSVFIGLLSVLSWPPRADVYRHAMTFYEMQGMQLSHVIADYYRGGDIILLSLQVLFGRLGLSFEIIRFLFIFLGYSIFLNLYNDIIQSNHIQVNHHSVLFFIIFFSIPFVGITYGLRYSLSLTIIAYYILKRNVACSYNKKDFLYLILAVFIHFGTIWLIVLIFFSKILPNRFNKLLFLSLYCILLLISSNADTILRMLPLGFYGDRLIDFYLATEDLRIKVNKNFIGMLPTYLNHLQYYVFLLLSVFYIPYNKHTKLLFIIFLFSAFTSGLPTLTSRINQIILICGATYAYPYINLKKILCYFLIVVSIIPAITGWRGYLISNINYIIGPIPIALAQSYDYMWLRTNLDADGTLNIYKR